MDFRSNARRDLDAPLVVADRSVELPAVGRAHLIGIGGAGMRSLAHLLRDRGWRVTGSDAGLMSPKLLPGTSIRVSPGHSPRNVPTSADLVVYSDAVGAENIERRRARRLDVPMLSYPQALGRFLNEGVGVAVAGTHGKSTTTALAAAILIHAGFDPSVVLGARPCGWTSGGRAGEGKHVLAEACEYRGNFLHLSPRAAVITGIEPDHFDYFASEEELVATFARFASQVASTGFIVARGDCRRTRQACEAAQARIVTFGTADSDDWQATNTRGAGGYYRFEVRRRGELFLKTKLRVPGRHNVDNALAAIALAGELGASATSAREASAAFAGVSRRMQSFETPCGITIVDDYAHHPSAVAAALAAARELYPGRRVQVVFEPHQTSRLAALLDEFAQTLQNAEKVWIADVFRARESGCAAVDSRVLAERINDGGGRAEAVAPFGRLLQTLDAAAAPDDVIVTLGAGEIGRLRHAFVERLRGRCAA